MSYFVSLIVLFSLLIYFEFNRNAVVEPSNLEQLDIPIFATLPSVKKLDKGYHLSQMFLEDVNSEFSEAIRTLRTLLVAKFKKNKPEYLYIKGKELGVHKDSEKTIKVIAGKFEKAEGPQKNHNVDPIYFHVIINEGKVFTFNIPSGHNSFIYLLKGELKIGEEEHDETNDSNLILLKKGNKVSVKANKKTEFLFIAGKPIGEPIARGGPFVMNTKAEILEAIQDYNNGTFAKY